jgi:hypothetical protein
MAQLRWEACVAIRYFFFAFGPFFFFFGLLAMVCFLFVGEPAAGLN